MMKKRQKNSLKCPYLFVFFSLCLVFTFIGLGTWQLKRKIEKEALLHSLAQAWVGEAHNVDDVQTPVLMKPLYAIGRYIPGKTIFLQARTFQGKNGIYVLSVFQTQKGKFLLIQRGWASKEFTPLSSGNIKIEGIVRRPSPPTYFQPSNKPPIYFWIDLETLSKELDLPLLPYYVVAKKSHDPQIIPTEPFPLPPNNHLEYALTWYVLAFAVLSMLLWSLKYGLPKESL